MSGRRAGIIQFKINGNIYDVKGNVTYSLGLPMREALVGHDRVHGYKEMPTVPFCELELTDSGDLALTDLGNTTDATITLALANGKTITFAKAYSANPDGLSVGTEEGVISARFEAETADEI